MRNAQLRRPINYAGEVIIPVGELPARTEQGEVADRSILALVERGHTCREHFDLRM
jgi:hypothetical protein